MPNHRFDHQETRECQTSGTTRWAPTVSSSSSTRRPIRKLWRSLFERMGFKAVAKHRQKNVTLLQARRHQLHHQRRAGQLRAAVREQHGPCACAMAFRVKDARARSRSGRERRVGGSSVTLGPMELEHPGDQGHWRLLDLSGRPLPRNDYGDNTIYDIDFARRSRPILAGTAAPSDNGLDLHRPSDAQRPPRQHGEWAEFYERLFDFHEIRYFDIEGKLTGLVSKAMASPCGKIRIPLNESPDDASADPRIPQRLPGRRHPAHCTRFERYLSHCRPRCKRAGVELPGHTRHLLRLASTHACPATGSRSMRCGGAAS